MISTEFTLHSVGPAAAFPHGVEWGSLRARTKSTSESRVQEFGLPILQSSSQLSTAFSFKCMPPACISYIRPSSPTLVSGWGCRGSAVTSAQRPAIQNLRLPPSRRATVGVSAKQDLQNTLNTTENALKTPPQHYGNAIKTRSTLLKRPQTP